MARRKRGQPIHGWLILDKPAGISSAAAVAKAKWALDAQKAGHAGTLDPGATGLLAIAFGEATKTVTYITDAMKSYRFNVRWGSSTSTDDAEGDVLATSAYRPSKAEINAALPEFTGNIMQVPPQVSAVKIDGARAYTRVRNGETVVIEARPLLVDRLSLVDIPDSDSAEFEMVCGKGGYVRSIARDLGETLGCLGHVESLRRLSTGPFDLTGAISWSDLDTGSRAPEMAGHLLPLETALAGVAKVECPDPFLTLLSNGGNVPVIPPQDAQDGDQVWIRNGEHPLAIGRIQGSEFHPERVFVF